VPIVLKSASLTLLEPSGLVQACKGIALPLPLPLPLHTSFISFVQSTCSEIPPFPYAAMVYSRIKHRDFFIGFNLFQDNFEQDCHLRVVSSRNRAPFLGNEHVQPTAALCQFRICRPKAPLLCFNLSLPHSAIRNTDLQYSVLRHAAITHR